VQLAVSCHGIGSAGVRLIRWCGLSANFESFCADFCVVRLIRRAANIPKITVLGNSSQFCTMDNISYKEPFSFAT
jgi:hypothetical protein